MRHEFPWLVVVLFAVGAMVLVLVEVFGTGRAAPPSTEEPAPACPNSEQVRKLIDQSVRHNREIHELQQRLDKLEGK